jgi:hypothetical protein
LRPRFRRRRNARALPFTDSFGRGIERCARLHLDEYNKLVPTRDDVDFAARAFPAPRQNAIALGDEIGDGAAFRRNADAKRGDLFRPRGANRFSLARHHSASLASSSAR